MTSTRKKGSLIAALIENDLQQEKMLRQRAEQIKKLKKRKEKRKDG